MRARELGSAAELYASRDVASCMRLLVSLPNP
jgi:hypothetical protein